MMLSKHTVFTYVGTILKMVMRAMRIISALWVVPLSFCETTDRLREGNMYI
jgi:hypothetical protein